MVLLLAAAGQSVVKMLNPVAVIAAARRLGRDYLLHPGRAGRCSPECCCWGTSWPRASSGWSCPCSRTGGGGVRHLPRRPSSWRACSGCCCTAAATRSGYGAPSDYLEPVLGDARPRHAGASSARGSLAVLAEPPSPVLRALHRDAVRAGPGGGGGRSDKALALYPELQEPRLLKQVDAAHHLFVGQAAAAQGQYALAVKALESAADVAPDGPSASRGPGAAGPRLRRAPPGSPSAP